MQASGLSIWSTVTVYPLPAVPARWLITVSKCTRQLIMDEARISLSAHVRGLMAAIAPGNRIVQCYLGHTSESQFWQVADVKMAAACFQTASATSPGHSNDL